MDNPTADLIASLDKYQAILRSNPTENGRNTGGLMKQLSKMRVALSASSSDDQQTKIEKKERKIFKVSNKYIQKAHNDGEPDFLYHLGLVVSVDHTAQIFHDVKYVCVGGTPSRMHEFAVICLEVLQIKVPTGLGVTDLCGGHARYVMYKAGPVLTVSHGMGNPSLSIMLHEVLKLLHYAQAGKDVKLIRIGTCGGIGTSAGTTIISNTIYNGLHQNYYDQYILGKLVRRPAILDKQLCQDLMFHATKPGMDIPVVMGNTLCADDFYEEQARIDGAFCNFTNEERMVFLEKCYHEYGIRNFEMESLAFAAMTYHAGLKAAVVCIALVDRLLSDKIGRTAEKNMEEWTRRPQRIVAELIRHELLDTPDNRNVDLLNLRKELATTTDHLYPSLHNGVDSASDSSRGSSLSENSAHSLEDGLPLAESVPPVVTPAGAVPSSLIPGTFRPVDPAALMNCGSADVVLK